MVGIFLRFRICPTASLQKKEFPFKILRDGKVFLSLPKRRIEKIHF